jgi:hypothetical protein
MITPIYMENPLQLPVELRLVGGANTMEGRVEVRYHGVWGTICDDDFAVPAATVICRSLGFGGPAEAKKDGFFGPGEGQIWLDQLHCVGNETGVAECLHSYRGEHNCKHNEDAAVICALGDVRQSLVSSELHQAACSKYFEHILYSAHSYICTLKGM